MLSILIPTYNYNIFPLVSELKSQCDVCKIEYEIICLDDASKLFHEENSKINDLKNCSYTILEKNIGRSSIRNLLAKKAKKTWLLFLDADVFPQKKTFIAEYIPYINETEKAVNGGLLYPEQKPEKQKIFRWVYGKNREALDAVKRNKNRYQSFLTLNFLIKKSIFEKVKFNEKIPNLRHEDTLFSYDLMCQNIEIIHIQNPIYHFGMDNFEVAIKKEQESLVAIKYLLENKLLPADYIKITRYFQKIKKFRLTFLFNFSYKLTKKLFLKNFSSSNPSLLLFDLYRLEYLCTLENK